MNSWDKIVFFGEDSAMTPAEFVAAMFEKTDENGMLHLADWHFDIDSEDGGYGHDVYCQCRVKWNEKDIQVFQRDFDVLYASLGKIAAVYDELTDDAEENKRLLGSQELFDIWDTYVRDFDTTGVDMDMIHRIHARDIDLVIESDEEQAVYDSYCVALDADSAKRVGQNICAYDVVIYAMRLCKLMSLQAPEIMLTNEAQILAAMIALHKYAVSMEKIGK